MKRLGAGLSQGEMGPKAGAYCWDEGRRGCSPPSKRTPSPTVSRTVPALPCCQEVRKNECSLSAELGTMAPGFPCPGHSLFLPPGVHPPFFGKGPSRLPSSWAQGGWASHPQPHSRAGLSEGTSPRCGDRSRHEHVTELAMQPLAGTLRQGDFSPHWGCLIGGMQAWSCWPPSCHHGAEATKGGSWTRWSFATPGALAFASLPAYGASRAW